MPRSVPSDRPGEALVELDLRLEAEDLARLLDVRDAQLDVGVVERLEDDLPGAAGEPLHALREVVDVHGRAGVPDVEAVADGLRPLEAEERRLDHVVDVAPGTDLGSVAVHDEVAARERGLDEGADRTAADLAGPVDVERVDGNRGEAELLVVGVGHVLAGELRDGVRPAGLADGADRRDLSPADVVGVPAEDLARREVEEALDGG